MPIKIIKKSKDNKHFMMRIYGLIIISQIVNLKQEDIHKVVSNKPISFYCSESQINVIILSLKLFSNHVEESHDRTKQRTRNKSQHSTNGNKDKSPNIDKCSSVEENKELNKINKTTKDNKNNKMENIQKTI